MNAYFYSRLTFSSSIVVERISDQRASLTAIPVSVHHENEKVSWRNHRDISFLRDKTHPTRRRKESMSDSVPVADIRGTNRPMEYLDCAPARRRLGIIDAREARPVYLPPV